jgi:hypothetical protein
LLGVGGNASRPSFTVCDEPEFSAYKYATARNGPLPELAAIKQFRPNGPKAAVIDQPGMQCLHVSALGVGRNWDLNMQITVGKVDKAVFDGKRRRKCRYSGLVHKTLLAK